MPALEITPDLKPLQALCNHLPQALLRLDMQAMFESIGGAVKTSVRHRFQTGKGPDGAAWQPSVAAKNGGTTLIGRGHLRDSITYAATADGVEIGTNLKYAAIHQFGGTITAQSAKHLKFRIGNQWRSVASVTLPARPYLGLDADDETEITAIVEDYIQRALSDV